MTKACFLLMADTDTHEAMGSPWPGQDSNLRATDYE